MVLNLLKKAKKNELMAVVVIACCILFVIYYLLFLSPVILKFLELHRDVSRTQSKLDSAMLSINRTPQIKKEISELDEKGLLYANKLPKEEEFPLVLENLSDMAKTTGVKITKIMPYKDYLPVSDSGSISAVYKQREISITAQCGYHQLGEFIAELEGAERFMETSDIRINSNAANPKRHNIELVVKTFILKDDTYE